MLLSRFIDNIREQNLFQNKDHLLLAVSGGVDSVVLCELCHQASFHFSIAHCNFQLRDPESERDEAFVKALANKYGVPFFVKKFDTESYASEKKISIQVAARELRYEWFEELIRYQVAGISNQQSAVSSQQSAVGNQQSGISDQVSALRQAPRKRDRQGDSNPPTSNIEHRTSNIPPHRTSNIVHRTFLLTAHHANDNIETLLMNFFKGTGIKGLQGILPKQGNIIRPLLFARKEELLQFAKENELSFVEDSSNASDKYTRNFFRNQLLPSIEKVFPKVEENLINNIDRNREIEILYRQAMAIHLKRLVEKKGNEIHIPVLKLLRSSPVKTILYEIIKDYGFTAHQTDEAIDLLQSESGKYISSATHRIIKNRKWLIVAPNNTLEASNILINEDDTQIHFEEGTIHLKMKKAGAELSNNKIVSATNNEVMLDAGAVRFPLLLRKWKQGDYFYPLGMPHKKKLSKFFIDQKLSITEKEKIWVLESDKKIIWILGKRIDDRFKLKPNTKDILCLSYIEF